MAQRDARLQVPIDQDVLDELQMIADDLGFDSVPAMVRFWAKGEIKKRSQQTGLSGPNAIVLKYIEIILALKPEPISASHSLDYVMMQLRRTRRRRFFEDLPQGPTSDKIFGT